MFASGLVGPDENSGARTSSFRCNITNYYFYFRLIAFVNSDILAELPGNAVAQAGGVADGGTSGRTPRREVLYDRPQTRDCPYRNDARHDARSHAPDGLLEVAENAAEFAAEDGNRQARTHPAFRDQRGREGRRPGGADNERGRVSGDARWLCAGIFVEGWAEAFAGRGQRRRSRGQRFCAGGGQGCAFHARLRAGAGARSDREDGRLRSTASVAPILLSVTRLTKSAAAHRTRPHRPRRNCAEWSTSRPVSA